jgi:signal transduction histidine kinase
VSIYIEFSDKKVMFDIHDNGTGFDVPATLSGFAAQHKLGIMGMEERVRLVGGSFCIKSKVGGGTRITVEIPLETTTM